ncbi:MAG: hypothetical protein ACRD0D_02960 [Acidimicrobiales bacterium]
MDDSGEDVVKRARTQMSRRMVRSLVAVASVAALWVTVAAPIEHAL